MERGNSLRPKQAVRVGDDADSRQGECGYQCEAACRQILLGMRTLLVCRDEVVKFRPTNSQDNCRCSSTRLGDRSSHVIPRAATRMNFHTPFMRRNNNRAPSAHVLPAVLVTVAPVVNESPASRHDESTTIMPLSLIGQLSPGSLGSRPSEH